MNTFSFYCSGNMGIFSRPSTLNESPSISFFSDIFIPFKDGSLRIWVFVSIDLILLSELLISLTPAFNTKTKFCHNDVVLLF